MTMLHWCGQLLKKQRLSRRVVKQDDLDYLCSFCYRIPPHDKPYFVKPCGHHNCLTCSIGPCPACGYRMSWAWPKVGRRHMISGSPFGG